MLTRWPLPDVTALERRRPTPFDPQSLLRSLIDADVGFVVVGGLAEVLHGAPFDTDDVDIVVESADDLPALGAVLTSVDARAISGDDPAGISVEWTPEALRSTSHLRLMTDFGRLDLINEPGFGRTLLHPVDAAPMEVGALMVPVATLDWLISAKDASSSRIHRRVIPTLLALRDELQG